MGRGLSNVQKELLVILGGLYRRGAVERGWG